MAFTLPPLPYATNALEPHIDAQTMEIHHGKHHNAYVNNLNAALEKAPELADKSLDELLQEPQRGARGGPHRRPQQRRRPLEPLACSGRSWARTPAARRPASSADAINSAFGDFEKFKEQFSAAGVGALRLGLGVARSTTAASSSIIEHAEPGQPAHGRQDGADPRPRRVGARLLPQVPEPPPGLHRRRGGTS